MAVLVLDLPVLAMDVEPSALVLAAFASGIDGILLLVKVAAATGRAVFIGIPAAVGVEHTMRHQSPICEGGADSSAKRSKEGEVPVSKVL